MVWTAPGRSDDIGSCRVMARQLPGMLLAFKHRPSIYCHSLAIWTGSIIIADMQRDDVRRIDSAADRIENARGRCRAGQRCLVLGKKCCDYYYSGGGASLSPCRRERRPDGR